LHLACNECTPKGQHPPTQSLSFVLSTSPPIVPWIQPPPHFRRTTPNTLGTMTTMMPCPRLWRSRRTATSTTETAHRSKTTSLRFPPLPQSAATKQQQHPQDPPGSRRFKGPPRRTFPILLTLRQCFREWNEPLRRCRRGPKAAKRMCPPPRAPCRSVPLMVLLPRPPSVRHALPL
jgi:hypothetical protein